MAKTFFEICRKCGGSGTVAKRDGGRTCPECFGRGMVDYTTITKSCNNQITRLKEQIVELEKMLAKLERRDKPQDAIHKNSVKGD